MTSTPATTAAALAICARRSVSPRPTSEIAVAMTDQLDMMGTTTDSRTR